MSPDDTDRIVRAVIDRLAAAGPTAPGAGAVREVVREALREVADPPGPGGEPVRLPLLAAGYTTARGSVIPDAPAPGDRPPVDHCALCVEQERTRAGERAVVSATGLNRKGIVAAISSRIAECDGDILDLSQTLVGDYFTIILVVDVSRLDSSFADFKQRLSDLFADLGVHGTVTHDKVFRTLQRI